MKKSSICQGTMRTINSYICWLQGKFKPGVVSKKSCRTIVVRTRLMPFIWLSGHGPYLSGLVSRILFIYRKGSFPVGEIETVHEPTGFKQHSFMILPFWRSRFWPWSHSTKNQGAGETIHFDVSKGDFGLPWWLKGKESTCQCGRHEFDPWVGKIPWRREWQPTPVFSPGESHAQRSLDDYNPRDRKRVRHDFGLNTTRRFYSFYLSQLLKKLIFTAFIFTTSIRSFHRESPLCPPSYLRNPRYSLQLKILNCHQNRSVFCHVKLRRHRF